MAFWLVAAVGIAGAAFFITWRQHQRRAPGAAGEGASRALEREFITPLMDAATPTDTADETTDPGVDVVTADTAPPAGGARVIEAPARTWAPDVHVGGGATDDPYGQAHGTMDLPAVRLGELDPTPRQHTEPSASTLP